MGAKRRTLQLQRYGAQVSSEFMRTYGISWADAAGDTAPLEEALREGQSPAEFVRWWGEKYGLVPVAELNPGSFGRGRWQAALGAMPREIVRIVQLGNHGWVATRRGEVTLWALGPSPAGREGA